MCCVPLRDGISCRRPGLLFGSRDLPPSLRRGTEGPYSWWRSVDGRVGLWDVTFCVPWAPEVFYTSLKTGNGVAYLGVGTPKATLKGFCLSLVLHERNGEDVSRALGDTTLPYHSCSAVLSRAHITERGIINLCLTQGPSALEPSTRPGFRYATFGNKTAKYFWLGYKGCEMGTADVFDMPPLPTSSQTTATPGILNNKDKRPTLSISNYQTTSVERYMRLCVCLDLRPAWTLLLSYNVAIYFGHCLCHPHLRVSARKRAH